MQLELGRIRLANLTSRTGAKQFNTKVRRTKKGEGTMSTKRQFQILTNANKHLYHLNDNLHELRDIASQARAFADRNAVPCTTPGMIAVLSAIGARDIVRKLLCEGREELETIIAQFDMLQKETKQERENDLISLKL